MGDRWLSVEEISKYLGISTDTVYRWLDERSIPGHRVGKKWKFKTVEVDEWIRGGGADLASPPDSPRDQAERGDS